MSARQKTTPNVRKSQARRSQRREERRQEEKEAAAQQGISVEALQEQRFREGQRVIAAQNREGPVLIPAPPSSRTEPQPRIEGRWY